MLLQKKIEEPILSSSLMFQNSAQTLLVSKEGLPISVPTNLLRLFSSSYLTPLLDLPCCVSTSIILPDVNVKTLSTLVELLKNGTSIQDESSTSSISIKDVARTLGIRVGSLSVNNEPVDQEPNNVPTITSVRSTDQFPLLC